MAGTPATITAIAGTATPYSIVYKAVGGTTDGVLTWTTMQNDLHAGPLKALLTQLAATPAGFVVLNLNSTSAPQPERVRIYFVVGADESEGCQLGGSINIHWVANGLSVLLPVEGAESNGTVLLEIRFRHSRKR